MGQLIAIWRTVWVPKVLTLKEPRSHCPMYNVSFIFFDKYLYFLIVHGCILSGQSMTCVCISVYKYIRVSVHMYVYIHFWSVEVFSDSKYDSFMVFLLSFVWFYIKNLKAYFSFHASVLKCELCAYVFIIKCFTSLTCSFFPQFWVLTILFVIYNQFSYKSISTVRWVLSTSVSNCLILHSYITITTWTLFINKTT